MKTSMIACVRLPHFIPAAEGLRQPRLTGRPFVVAEPPDGPRQVYAASPQAAEAGIHAGMKLTAAQTVCPGLGGLPADYSHYRQVLSAVLEALTSFSDFVEPETGLELRADARRRKRSSGYIPGGQLDEAQAAIGYLDLGRLKAAEVEQLAEAICAVVQQQFHLPVTVGVAGGKFTARVAASSLAVGNSFVVAAGEEAAFLSGYPAALLPVDGETLRLLALLGLRTLGQVAALPAAALAGQFGAEGQTMHRLASGRDTRRVARYVPRETLALAQPFEPPLADREVLVAVLRRLVLQGVERLTAGSKMAGQVALAVQLEDGSLREQALPLRQPSAHTEHLTRTAVALLDALSLTSGVAEVVLTLDDIGPAVLHQLSLFPRQPVPQERLQAVLDDLVGRYGAECFYWVRPVDRQARLLERRYILTPVVHSRAGGG